VIQSFDSQPLKSAITRPCPVTGKPQREIADCPPAHLRQVAKALPESGAFEIRVIAESRYSLAQSLWKCRYDRKAARARCHADIEAGHLSSRRDLTLAGFWK
jgi:hypothetical protein